MKRPLSLFEVVIALGLTAILLTTLFSCYRRFAVSKRQLDILQQALYPKVFTQARLIQIFDNLEDGCPLTVQDGTLFFTFDNGIDPDPEFCGTIQGTLFVNTDQQLILKVRDTREEVLQKQVNAWSVAFFDRENNSWSPTWKGALFPPQVRIHVNGENTTFRIPNVSHEVESP